MVSVNLSSADHTFVYRVKPRVFSAVVETAACYIKVDGKILLLRRANGKSEGGKWGVPGGKIEAFESADEAVIREVFEETGIAFEGQQPQYIGEFFIQKPKVAYVFHMYYIELADLPNVILNSEHQDYQWVAIEDVPHVPFMSGGEALFYHFKSLVSLPKITREAFYFIRHGETDVNADPNTKRVDYDLPLNQQGRMQAERAREVITKIPLARVCCSPIQRAVETKHILTHALDIDHLELDDLSECKAHVWNKMVQLERGSGFQACGEVENFLNRTLRGVETALAQKSPTLIVSHGGVHFALCYLLAIDNHPWKIKNCQLVHFQPVGDAGWNAKIIDFS